VFFQRQPQVLRLRRADARLRLRMTVSKVGVYGPAEAGPFREVTQRGIFMVWKRSHFFWRWVFFQRQPQVLRLRRADARLRLRMTISKVGVYGPAEAEPFRGLVLGGWV
jgi:hypothetical protein